MFRIVLCILVLAGCAAQPTQPTAFVYDATAPGGNGAAPSNNRLFSKSDKPLFPLTPTSAAQRKIWQPAHCTGLESSFSSAYSPYTQEVAPNTTSSEQVKYSDISGHYQEDSECVCTRGARMQDITRAQASSAMTELLGKKDFTVKSISNFDGQLGKATDFVAATPSPFGEYTVVGRLFWIDDCVFGVVAGWLEKDSDAMKGQGIAFLNSAQPRSSHPVFQQPDSTTSAEGGVAQRLRELQNLRDQKLITAEEYEAKRKAILNGL
jgi:hypothetical protein